jgi:predicted transcriptional regulator
MADDLHRAGLTVELSGEVAEKLRLCASASRTDVDALVRNVIKHYLDDWYETCERLAQFDRDGISIGVEEALAEFESELAAAIERRAKERAI